MGERHIIQNNPELQDYIQFDRIRSRDNRLLDFNDIRIF